MGALITLLLAVLVIWIVDRVRRRSGAASNVGATDQKWSHPGVLEPYTIDAQNRALDSQPAEPEALSLEIVTRIATYEEPRGQRPMPAPGSVNGAAFEITYADADGVITERVIRVQEVRGENGFTYIDAHCFLADAKRTFRGDRILSMKNHRTGEQIRDPSKFFAMFYDEEDDLVLAHEAVMSRARPGLQVLVWVARADGELDDAMMDIMLDYIEARRRIGPKAAGLEWNRDVAKRWIMFTRPYFDNAAGALSRMPPAGRVSILTREFARRTGATSPARQKRATRLLKT